jgi:hypothetical protein
MGNKLKPAEGAILGLHVGCYKSPAGWTCHWQSGGRAYLNLKLTDKIRKQAGKALDDGKKVKAKVTVRATDAAGNVATAKRTIELVK